MMTGELNFSENMFTDNDPDKPYYKLGYVMYILFAIGLVILVSNLLTGIKPFFFSLKRLIFDPFHIK